MQKELKNSNKCSIGTSMTTDQNKVNVITISIHNPYIRKLNTRKYAASLLQPFHRPLNAPIKEIKLPISACTNTVTIRNSLKRIEEILRLKENEPNSILIAGNGQAETNNSNDYIESTMDQNKLILPKLRTKRSRSLVEDKKVVIPINGFNRLKRKMHEVAKNLLIKERKELLRKYILRHPVVYLLEKNYNKPELGRVLMKNQDYIKTIRRLNKSDICKAILSKHKFINDDDDAYSALL